MSRESVVDMIQGEFCGCLCLNAAVQCKVIGTVGKLMSLKAHLIYLTNPFFMSNPQQTGSYSEWIRAVNITLYNGFSVSTTWEPLGHLMWPVGKTWTAFAMSQASWAAMRRSGLHVYRLAKGIK